MWNNRKSVVYLYQDVVESLWIGNIQDVGLGHLLIDIDPSLKFKCIPQVSPSL